MSKERLEEAIKRIKGNQIMLGRQSGKSQFYEDMNVVIKQAERVQELKKDNEYLRDVFIPFLQDNVAELERQNKRYHEAIDKALGEGVTTEDCNEAIDRVYSILSIVLEESE